MSEQSTLPGRIAARAAAGPDRPALDIAGETLTYAALVARVSTLAGWLTARGLAAGDRVLVTGANSTALVVAALAAMWAGGVEVVANPSGTPREFDHIIDDCTPRIVLADTELVPAMAARVGMVVSPLCPPDLAADPMRAPAALAGSALASLQYTSGTTGVPKGAMLSHTNLLAYLDAIRLAWQWRASDVLLHSLPLAHGHGRNGLYTALVSGASAVVLPRTDPAAIQAALRAHRATVFYAVPTIWERLLGNGLDPAAFAGLRLYTSGSAALSPAVSDALAAALPGGRPLERYGCTETGIVTTNPLHGERLAGTVGRPVHGAEVVVLDPDGAHRPDGQIGEIAVRGPMVFTGYWGWDQQATGIQDGWFRTGDLGRYAPELNGHLVISGRRKELIITGGLNVYPREVELVAEQLPDVGEAAVVGVESQRWGEEVVLAVVPADPSRPPNPEQVIAALRGELAGYKVPKQCKVVSGIPRNSTGKILRRQLAVDWPALPRLSEP